MDDENFQKWKHTAYTLGRCIGLLEVIRDEQMATMPPRLREQLNRLLSELEHKEAGHD